jgi:hypothetical protein
MSIKPSAAAEIRTLVESLSSADEVRREGAIARLSIIGPRAVDRLLAAYASPDTSRATRVAILRVLEAVGDARVLPMAREALHDGGDLAIAAAGALRGLLNAAATDASTGSLDALVETALDRSVERRVRMAAYDALRDMPDDVRARVGDALQHDPDKTISSHLTDAGRETAAEVVWQDALEGRLCDEPGALREAMQTRVMTAPLNALRRLVDEIVSREGDAAYAPRAREWQAVRGALHQALALRGSRIALYDLRETVSATVEPLPATFLTALHTVGDEESLHAIAAAHGRAGGDERWRHQLEAAFGAIVKREKLGRKAVAKLLDRPSK